MFEVIGFILVLTFLLSGVLSLGFAMMFTYAASGRFPSDMIQGIVVLLLLGAGIWFTLAHSPIYIGLR